MESMKLYRTSVFPYLELLLDLRPFGCKEMADPESILREGGGGEFRPLVYGGVPPLGLPQKGT